MDKISLEVLKNIFVQKLVVKDGLGEHSGVIDELKINNRGIFAYGLFFGFNSWFKLNQETLEWEVFKEVLTR